MRERDLCALNLADGAFALFCMRPAGLEGAGAFQELIIRQLTCENTVLKAVQRRCRLSSGKEMRKWGCAMGMRCLSKAAVRVAAAIALALSCLPACPPPASAAEP